MVPKFERRVRGFAIDTSGAAVVALLAIGVSSFSAVFAYILAILGFFGFYFVPYFFSAGQSLGKRVEKTRIVNLDNSMVPLWKILLRETFKVAASILTFGVYLVVAFFALSEKNSSRTIHDYIFKTKVVSLTKPEPKSKDEYISSSPTKDKWGF